MTIFKLVIRRSFMSLVTLLLVSLIIFWMLEVLPGDVASRILGRDATAETLAQLAGVSVVFDLPPEAEKAGYSTVSRAVQNPARLEGLGWSPVTSLKAGLKRTLDILTSEK